MLTENTTFSVADVPDLHEIAAALQTDPEALQIVPPALLPACDADLPDFCQRFAEWGERLVHPQAVLWVQPLSPELTLTLEEAEQILGLVCGVKIARAEVAWDGRRSLVLAGLVREYALGLMLRWSRRFLESRFAFSRLLRRFTRSPELARRFLHFIELPENRLLTRRWAERVRALLDGLGAVRERLPLGVFLERIPAQPETDHAAAFDQLAEIAAALGIRDRLLCQWIGGPVGAPRTNLLLAFARRHGLVFDFSLRLSAPPAKRGVPYRATGAFFPLDFDLRKPSFAQSSVVETPHVPAALLRKLPLAARPSVLNAPLVRRLLAGTQEDVLPRLQKVLDRTRRANYLQSLQEQSELCRYWHHYHVYNWAPPPLRVLRMIAFDADDLTRVCAPLAALALQDPDPTQAPLLCEAGPMLAHLRQQALEGVSANTQSILHAQITAHQYLATGGRDKLSPDSERLIQALPPALGCLLELGFGYGLTAQRIAHRATRYLGIDLQGAQAKTFGQRGGTGLVGDMHALPFPNDCFDTIIADNTLEHAYDPLRALCEIRRVLRRSGRLYALVPLDGVHSDYQIRSHLWKIDEQSLREAARSAGLNILQLDILDYTELGYYGCFPASRNKTCLVVMAPR